ncbi:hypothetical protein NPIL_626661, partial [Nephila pilipes]
MSSNNDHRAHRRGDHQHWILSLYLDSEFGILERHKTTDDPASKTADDRFRIYGPNAIQTPYSPDIVP